jgi:hypothetical protein
MLIDLCQGSAELEHFLFLKELSEDNKGQEVIVVFTKFSNALNDIGVEISQKDGYDKMSEEE